MNPSLWFLIQDHQPQSLVPDTLTMELRDDYATRIFQQNERIFFIFLPLFQSIFFSTVFFQIQLRLIHTQHSKIQLRLIHTQHSISHNYHHDWQSIPFNRAPDSWIHHPLLWILLVLVPRMQTCFWFHPFSHFLQTLQLIHPKYQWVSSGWKIRYQWVWGGWKIIWQEFDEWHIFHSNRIQSKNQSIRPLCLLSSLII